MARKEFTLQAVNHRLRAAGVGVEVLQRGRKLSLRATLPAKPGSGKTRHHQQTIALGKYATPEGFEEAEGLALELRAQLQRGRFTWDDWLNADFGRKYEAVGSAMERYKAHCMRTLIRDAANAEAIWNIRFWTYLKHLPSASPLVPETFIRTAERATKPNTRSRQLSCQELRRFAEFCGVEVNLAPYAGSYSAKDARRDIPEDSEIEAAIDRIPNRGWQWIAAMMAVYGLRDHEAWLCSLERRKSAGGRSVLVCVVHEGTKTGGRVVQPSKPEWLERWRVEEVERPAITAKQLRRYGNSTSVAFNRYKIGFAPYNLRHAAAIRFSTVVGLPIATSAAMMGHSPQVHLNIYNRWISAHQHQQIYDAAMERLRDA